MKHKLFVLLGGFFLTAGLLMAAGCFTMPTSPAVVAQGGGTGGGGIPDDGTIPDSGVIPTPTPGIIGGGSTGSISGTVTNTGGAAVSISALNTGSFSHSGATAITGDGQYTILNLEDGDYTVSGIILSPMSFSNSVNVTITNGNAVTGVDLAF